MLVSARANCEGKKAYFNKKEMLCRLEFSRTLIVYTSMNVHEQHANQVVNRPFSKMAAENPNTLKLAKTINVY